MRTRHSNLLRWINRNADFIWKQVFPQWFENAQKMWQISDCLTWAFKILVLFLKFKIIENVKLCFWREQAFATTQRSSHFKFLCSTHPIKSTAHNLFKCHTNTPHAPPSTPCVYLPLGLRVPTFSCCHFWKICFQFFTPNLFSRKTTCAFGVYRFSNFVPLDTGIFIFTHKIDPAPRVLSTFGLCNLAKTSFPV